MKYAAGNTEITGVNHFANDPASCYEPECSSWEKYYGADDVARAVGGLIEITGCKLFMYKIKPNTAEGDCMLMDLTYKNGFKSSSTMRSSNRLLHVGLHECKQGKLPSEWCTDCNEGRNYVSNIYPIYTNIRRV